MILTKIALPTEPKSLKEESNIKARNALLTAPHILPLAQYAATLRERLGQNVFVPNFDPLDGGINAEFVFLFEKPGPKTDSTNGGSGFISRDNNDETAKSVFEFMNRIGLDRKRTLLWNTIPAWDGSRSFKGLHVKAGIQMLDELFPLLPHVKTVILVGKQAQKAEKWLNNQNVTIFKSAHPSPIVRARSRSMWESIPYSWAKAVSILKGP